MNSAPTRESNSQSFTLGKAEAFLNLTVISRKGGAGYTLAKQQTYKFSTINVYCNGEHRKDSELEITIN